MTAGSKRIYGFSLDSILQIISLEKKTNTLKVIKDDRVGFIDIDKGELVNASLGKVNGLDAVIEILLLNDVVIELQPLRDCDCLINKSLISVLLEVSKIKDDRKASGENDETELIEHVIENAYLRRYREAGKYLLQVIKENSSNASAWIWYYRIQVNVNTMKKALKMACGLGVADAFVHGEREKFEIVASCLTDDVAKKCYYCWVPLNKNAITCPCCKGILVVSRETLNDSGQVNELYLTEAKARYEHLLEKYPRSLVVTYCLALINVSFRSYRDALGYLDRAVKIAPDKPVFGRQLNLLLDHLARQSSQEVALEAAPAQEDAVVDGADTQKVILVVEDSATTRKVIAITLTRQGFRVVEAADGLEALSRVSEERPDLILLDVILPRMDGYKILSIIKGNREFRAIPVIMLTSKDGFINKMKGKMAGASAYLTKPFNPDEIISVINRHVI